MRTVKGTHPLAILSMVVLPQHLHVIWRVPPGDADYPLRWALIKRRVSRGGWQKTSIFVPVAKLSMSAASISGGIGNIKSGMMSINVLTIDIQIAILPVSIMYALRGEFHARRRHQPTGIA